MVMVVFHDFILLLPQSFSWICFPNKEKMKNCLLQGKKKTAKSSKLQKLVLFFVLFLCRKLEKNSLFRCEDVNFKWWKVRFTKCHAISKCINYTRFCFFFFSLSSEGYKCVNIWIPHFLSLVPTVVLMGFSVAVSTVIQVSFSFTYSHRRLWLSPFSNGFLRLLSRHQFPDILPKNSFEL